MIQKMDRKPRPAAYKRQQSGNEVQYERGWAGQHGQRPASDEEEDYRPQKESHQPPVRVDEEED